MVQTRLEISGHFLEQEACFRKSANELAYCIKKMGKLFSEPSSFSSVFTEIF